MCYFFTTVNLPPDNRELTEYSPTRSQVSSLSIVTRLWVGQPGFDSWQSIMSIMSRPTLGSTQPPIQWVPGLFSWRQSGQGMKLTTHLHLVLRLRMLGAIPPLPHMSAWRGAYLSARDNFIFLYSQLFMALQRNYVKRRLHAVCVDKPVRLSTLL
jgi:hypothetical protein